MLLKPQAVYPDPFRGGNNILVMCDCYKPDMTPIKNNTRKRCAELMEKTKDLVPWFGIEQEYTLFEADGVTPFGWPKGGYPGPQGPYYCSVGTENAYGRHIAEAHYRACLYAGINISGINGVRACPRACLPACVRSLLLVLLFAPAPSISIPPLTHIHPYPPNRHNNPKQEVLPGQWEYQVGPSVGIESGDQMWVSRYLLQRVCEAFGVIVSLDPKPIPGDWNGSGCHTNFSTEPMRKPGGFTVIIDALEKLRARHAEHIAAYGEGNERRLTGKHETASMDQFSYGVANRGASCRIPRAAEKDGA